MRRGNNMRKVVPEPRAPGLLSAPSLCSATRLGDSSCIPIARLGGPGNRADSVQHTYILSVKHSKMSVSGALFPTSRYPNPAESFYEYYLNNW